MSHDAPLTVPVLHEVDEAGEATGTTHFYCSAPCRALSSESGAPGEVPLSSVLETTRCETCGRDVHAVRRLASRRPGEVKIAGLLPNSYTEEDIGDLVTDLAHLVRRSGREYPEQDFDVERMFRCAIRDYIAETGEAICPFLDTEEIAAAVADYLGDEKNDGDSRAQDQS